MNKPAILLGILSAALLAAIVMRSQRAGNQLEAAYSETAGISNQLSEAQIKLNHNERLNAALKNEIAERATNAAGLSNQLAQLRTALAAARAETEVARAETVGISERANAFAAERDGLSNRVSELDLALHTQAERARAVDERAMKIQSDLADMSQQLAATELEKQRLDAVLADPEALRAQLEAVRKLQAAAQSPTPQGKPDYRFAARLEPDGTVSLSPPPIKKPLTN